MALVEDLEDQDEDSDDSALAHVMTNVVFSSLLEGGDNAEGSLLDAMMQGDEKEAIVQFRFIKNFIEKIRGSRIGRLLTDEIKSRVCGI